MARLPRYNQSDTKPQDLNKTGEFQQTDFGIEYQLKNTRLKKYSASLGLQWLREKERSTFSYITEDTFYDKTETLELKVKALNLSFLDKWTLKAESALKTDTARLGGSKYDNTNLSRTGATTNFMKWNGSVNMNRELPFKLQWRNNLNFQKFSQHQKQPLKLQGGHLQIQNLY